MQNCKKHPKYNGLKAPHYQCVDCLGLFSMKGANRPERISFRKNQVAFKDMNKYSRKEKHKAQW